MRNINLIAEKPLSPFNVLGAQYLPWICQDLEANDTTYNRGTCKLYNQPNISWNTLSFRTK